MNIDVLKSLLRYEPDTGLIYWVAKGKGMIKQKAAWSVYRQSLRDVTTQETFPWDITWPVEPGKE